MNNFLIKYFFCEEFSFKKGVWLGKFPFSIEIEHQEYNGTVHCAYKQSTPYPSIQNRFSFDNSFIKLDEKVIEEIKHKVNEKFDEQFEQLKTLFIEPRELYMIRPKIRSFQYDAAKSSDNHWVFSFTLEESPASKFNIEMELEGNTWFYTIESSSGSLVDYKNSLQWEDFLMDEIIKEIKLIPEIRYKFLYQKVKYKYRKRYR